MTLIGTSLAVQWLRFHAFSVESMGSIPGLGTKISHDVKKKKDPDLHWVADKFESLWDLFPQKPNISYSFIYGHVRTLDAFELWCWRRLLRVPWTARFFGIAFLWDWNEN